MRYGIACTVAQLPVKATTDWPRLRGEPKLKRRHLRILLIAVGPLVAGLLILSSSPEHPAVAAAAQTIFGSDAPAHPSDPDTANVELGTRFTAAVNGSVSEVRFFKGTGNTGTHIGRLYGPSGAVLGSVTFTGESASGWQHAALATPVPVTAGTIYTVSYTAPVGRYAGDNNYSFPKVTGQLTALSGVYKYGGGFPTATWQASNYFVDVAFVPAATTPGGTTTTAPQQPVSILNLPRVPWEGGPKYYSQFPRAASSGWNAPSFFPIGLWYPNAGNDASAQFDKSYGINMYVENNSDIPYSVYANNGMSQIGDPNDTFPPPAYAKAWPGRFLGDEIDGRYDVPAGQAFLQSVIDSIPKDDGRFQYANFTAIVAANYNLTQIAADNTYVNMYAGPVSVDAYWYTDPHCSIKPYSDVSFVPVNEAQCRTSSSYGKTIQGVRARDASDGKLKPVWAFVELMGTGNADPLYNFTITPGQLKGAAMDSIINEARGLMWFNQRFNEPCIAGTLIRTVQVDPNGCAAANAAAMREVNLQIQALAPVINTQSYRWVFGPNLDTMLKVKDGAAYIFSMISGDAASIPGPRTFTLPVGVRATSIEVLNENRSIPVVAGKFTDRFAKEYTYHIYKAVL
jgi:hypothetical protein